MAHLIGISTSKEELNQGDLTPDLPFGQNGWQTWHLSSTSYTDSLVHAGCSWWPLRDHTSFLHRPASTWGFCMTSGLRESGSAEGPFACFSSLVSESGRNKIWPAFPSKGCFVSFLSSPANGILANHLQRYREEVSRDRHLISRKIGDDSSFYTHIAIAKINTTMVSSFSVKKNFFLFLRENHSPTDFDQLPDTISWPVCVTWLLNAYI